MENITNIYGSFLALHFLLELLLLLGLKKWAEHAAAYDHLKVEAQKPVVQNRAVKPEYKESSFDQSFVLLDAKHATNIPITHQGTILMCVALTGNLTANFVFFLPLCVSFLISSNIPRFSPTLQRICIHSKNALAAFCRPH